MLGAAPPASATTPAGATPATAAQATRPDSLRLFLLTFGPGAAVWERFGHNALWIHDPVAGTDVAYHYGLFDMSESGFLTRFLQGRMAYSMGAADASRLVEAYRQVGRETTVQSLALPGPKIEALRAFLEWNLRPENRVYRYDYFRDNCSTRVRDALDRALDGALRRSLSGRPTSVTFRSEAVRLTAEDVLLTTGMDLGLGPLADQRLTRWELAFIPMRLRDDLRTMTLDVDGRAVPLVTGERRIPAVGSDASFAEPPNPRGRTLRLLLVGLLTGAGIAALGWLAARGPGAGWRRRLARWALGTVGALWGLVAGSLGLILLGLWTLTDHEFAWRNENLLQTSPLALLLAVLVPLAAVRGGSRTAWRVAAALAALSVAGLLLHPLPVTPQANLPIIALALPINLGIALALRPVRQGRPD